MLKTFSIGGIHPPGNKLSAGSPVERMSLPRSVVVPLSQHIGAPALPVVAAGDSVRAGELIAEADGFISANIHAPVSGTVRKIDGYTDISGSVRPAIYIDGNGNDDPVCRSRIHNDANALTPDIIIDAVKSAGIVGMGGAAFPTHVKLRVPEGKHVSHLLVNGAECEPYLTTDHRIMLERAADLIAGAGLMAKAVGARQCIIGVEDNKKDAVVALRKHIKGSDVPTDVVALKARYPQGSEKQLVDAILKRRIPSGKLPVDAGVVVQNVSTAVAVYGAVYEGIPLLERVVTVAGSAVATPRNLIVRIGTTVGEIMDYCGILRDDAGKVILGGPMMGRALAGMDVPVTKGTSGILVMSRKEAFRKKQGPCIRCAKCVFACPMSLEPYLLYKLSEQNEWDEAERHYIIDCIECGSCSYICPASIPLLDYIRFGKGQGIRRMRVRKS